MKLTSEGKTVGYILLGLLVLYNIETIQSVIGVIIGCLVVAMFAKGHQ